MNDVYQTLFSLHWISFRSNLFFGSVSTVDRRAKRKALLRQRILDASREILLSQGFAALTMRRVAEAIDYAPASIYLHFQSREQIAQELCFAGLKRLYAHLQTITAKDPATHLLGYARAYLEYAQNDPETYRLIFMADPQLSKAVFTHRDSGGAGEAALALIVTAFAEIQSGAKKPVAKPVELAELLWAGLHGIASLRLACSQALTSDEFRLAELLTGAIGATDVAMAMSVKKERKERKRTARIISHRDTKAPREDG